MTRTEVEWGRVDGKNVGQLVSRPSYRKWDIAGESIGSPREADDDEQVGRYRYHRAKGGGWSVGVGPDRRASGCMREKGDCAQRTPKYGFG